MRNARLSLAAAGIIAMLATGTAMAAPGGSAGNNPKLRCFSDDPATCSVSGDTVTLDTHSGGYAGAYFNNGKTSSGTPLSAVDYTFQYNCDPGDGTTACVGGGSPRWSIPIDSTGDGKTDGYAFIDAAGCGSTGTVSTADPACAVSYQGVQYANWDAFAAANPTYTIGNSQPFIITDTTEPGTTLLYGISITKS